MESIYLDNATNIGYFSLNVQKPTLIREEESKYENGYHRNLRNQSQFSRNRSGSAKRIPSRVMNDVNYPGRQEVGGFVGKLEP